MGRDILEIITVALNFFFNTPLPSAMNLNKFLSNIVAPKNTKQIPCAVHLLDS